MIPFSDLLKCLRAAYPWISVPFRNYVLKKKLGVREAGSNGYYAHFSITNPIKSAIIIRSVKIKLNKVSVPCPCMQKEGSNPDEKLGFCSITLAGHSKAEWEIPYQLIGTGDEPQAVVIEYETRRGVVKQKIQDPSLILWAIKNTEVPDSMKNWIPPNFEGILMFDDKEDFPAALGSVRKSLLDKTRLCYTLNGIGVSIENSASRSVEIESVYFVMANCRAQAFLEDAYAQKTLVPARKLRSQERATWILPQELGPSWQGTREAQIVFRISIGEESFLDTILKKL